MNVTSRIPFRLTLLLALAVFVLAACGAGSDDDEASSDTFAMATTAGGSAAAPTSASIPTSGGGSAAPLSGESPDLMAAAWDRKVIRNAQLTLSVTDVPGAVNWVRDVAAGKGGFVFSSSASIEQERQYSQLTIQVPAERFDETMNELRSSTLVEKVEREDSSSQDVSAEYVDNASRLKALRETESRFLDLLGDADTVDDILRMEYELSNVRSQIETIQGRQNYLDAATSFSTISVSLVPTGAPARASNGAEFSFTHIVERSWEHSSGVIQAVLITTLTLGIVGITLLPLAAAAYIALRVYRGRGRRSESHA